MFQAFVLKVSHKVASKMVHTNPMICIWLRPTKININKHNHYVRMTIRYNTKTPHLSYSISNTCQKPSLTITFSSSINAKTRRNNWFFSLQPMTIIAVPLYFPYKCIPSIINTRRQCLKPFMEWWNAQKTHWNTSLFRILPGNVLEITTHPRFAYFKAQKKSGNLVYDL